MKNIVLKDVSKQYGNKTALNHVNLEIPVGMYGLLGRNGAGKTTLMKILVTLLPLTSGEITINGVSLRQASSIRSMIGYLPQEFSLYPQMPVYEAMEYLAILSNVPRKERKQRIEQLLKKVNLFEDRLKKVKSLSGGMKRRLGIAQALLHDPKVLIVDEPTAGLDPEERIRFRNLLCEFAVDRIVILSTHIVGDIEATCKNLAILKEGNLIYHGDIDTLLAYAKDKVYEIDILQKDLINFKESYLVTSMVTMKDAVHIRFLSEQQIPNADPCESGIEDAYLYLLQTKGGETIC